MAKTGKILVIRDNSSRFLWLNYFLDEGEMWSVFV